MKKHTVLDHGYVMFVEAWGHGIEGIGLSRRNDDCEVGIIEAARMSTGKGFEGWGPFPCPDCSVGTLFWSQCKKCKGTGQASGDEKLLNYLYTHQHNTPFEMAGMTIEVQAPIMVFREWHRHRTQSYNELSARYTPLPDLNYVPTLERVLHQGGSNKQASSTGQKLTEFHAKAFILNLTKSYKEIESLYQEALADGVPKELARCLLPVGRYSRMRASANLRNWLLFMTLRSTLKGPNAQWEIRQFADVVGTIIKDTFPRTWELFVGDTK